jgi:serine/threonine-protein kinase RsbW
VSADWRQVQDVTFCLAFGCEELSVPAMRRVLGDTLRGLGVAEESVYDLLLAASEACTTVQASSGRYEIVTSLSASGCQVEVIGPGCQDRNLAVLRACVDNVRLRRRPGRDTVVTMRKHITWSWDAPLRRVPAAS